MNNIVKSLVNPFINMELHSLVSIQPHQLNNELYLHLKNNLIKTVVNKCNNIGYICKVNEIISYKDGKVEAEDFSGNIVFDVTFNANICIPIKDTNIVCKIESIHKQLIIGNNGPIKCIIKTNDIDQDYFNVVGNGSIMIKLYNKPLQINDYVIISIRSHKSYVGDDKIGVMGYIYNMATEEDIKNYYYNKYIDDTAEISMLNTNNTEFSNDIISMNEDNDTDEESNKMTNIKEIKQSRSKNKLPTILEI
jgi:DNA-directed RNA polymerase subunit E'/Rpb7